MMRRAAAVTGVGLVVLLVAMPLETVSLHGQLRELRRHFGVGSARFTADDAKVGLFVVAVAVVVLVAVLLRRPRIMVWAAVPALFVAGWMLLVAVDIQFDTSFLADDVLTRVNRDRSLAVGGWLTVAGMLAVVVGLALPLADVRGAGAGSRHERDLVSGE